MSGAYETSPAAGGLSDGGTNTSAGSVAGGQQDRREVECTGTTSTYVPWTFGEVFACTVCGRRVRQDHNTRPVRPGRASYESLYPMPAHLVAASPVSVTEDPA
jgi:hypothetical protein